AQSGGQRQSAVDIGGAIDEAHLLVQALQLRVGELRRAVPQPQLIEPRALAHEQRKGARADLGIERAMITLLDVIEGLAVVGDQAREYVQPPGRAFRVCGARDTEGKFQPFQQRHEVDATRFQHRTGFEVDFVNGEVGKLVRDLGVFARQETGADAIGDGAQAQIDAGGLDLLVDDFVGRQHFAPRADEPLQNVARQNPGRVPAIIGLAIARLFWGVVEGQSGRHDSDSAHDSVLNAIQARRGAASASIQRNLRTSATASAKPTRSTGASGGSAANRRLGQAASSTANTPLSVSLRISRPNACFSRSRASKSSYCFPKRARRALCRMVGFGQGTLSKTPSRSDRPGTSTPSRKASVPNRQAFSSARNRSTSVPVSSASMCCAYSAMPASASGR